MKESLTNIGLSLSLCVGNIDRGTGAGLLVSQNMVRLSADVGGGPS